MSNSKISLLATGENDLYLTGEANHTFFKKHTNTHSHFGQSWSIVSNNDKNMVGKFEPNTTVSLRLPVEGDLIDDLMIRIKIAVPESVTDDWGDNNNNVTIEKYMNHYTGLSIIKKIIMKNNDKVISELDNTFICNYCKLHLETKEYIKFYKMASVGNQTINNILIRDTTLTNKKIMYLHIPVPFWFTKDSKQSFPMWALNNPNITFDIELDDYEKLTKNPFKFGNSENYIHDIELLINYTYLNNLEKKKFENLPLEYIIEQVDLVNTETLEIPSNASGGLYRKKIMLPKSNFVKYLMWGLTPKIIGSLTEYGTDGYHQFGNINGITNSSLTFNGNRLLDEVDSNFTSLITRYNNFKFPENDTPEINTSVNIDTNLHTYSFCLHPMDYKLSGFLNTDNFNTSELTVDIKLEPIANLTEVELKIYQIKHNILRFKNGTMDILYN